jgi:glucose-1-phosphate thymidylyltransferase
VNAAPAPRRYSTMDLADAVLVTRRSPDWLPWPSLGARCRHLAPVANEPILFHALERLERAGIRRAAVIVDGETGADIRAAVGDGSRWALEVSYVEDGRPEGLHAALQAAACRLSDGPLLIHHGEVVVQGALGDLGRHVSRAGLDALVLRHPPQVPGAGAPPSGYILGARMSDALRSGAAASARTGLEELVALARADGARVEVRTIEACSPCGGGQEALLEANRRLLDDLEGAPVQAELVRSRVQGRVLVHPTAHVSQSVIRGPAVIGPGTQLVHAYVGPYSSIGANVQMEGAEIENSIVLDGARLRFLPARLESSVIGSGAVVERTFDVPSAMRVSVGDMGEVRLS